MNKLVALFVLIILFVAGCAAVTAVLRPTIDSSAQALINHAVAPDPLADVMAVRDQAQDQSGSWWALIALLLICGLAVAGILVGMGRFPKAANAWRRMRKPHSSHVGQRPFAPLPQQDVTDLPQLPRTSSVQAVPEWENGVYHE